MLAKVDDGIASAIGTANTLWEDDEVRARIEAREDYYRRLRTEQIKMHEKDERIAKLDRQLAEKDKELAEKTKENLELLEKNEAQTAEIQRLRRQLAEKTDGRD